MSKDTGNVRIAKNTLFLSIRMLFVLILNLFTTRLILKSLGVNDFGVYNVIFGVVTMGMFINTSLSHGVQRFFNFELATNGESGAIKVFNDAIFIHLGMALFLILIGETVGLWYVSNKLVVGSGGLSTAEWVYQFSLLSFVIMIIQTPFSAVIMAYERMHFYAIVSIVDAILKFVIAFVLGYYYGDRLMLYGLLVSLISLFNFLMYFVYVRRHFKNIRFIGSFDVVLFKDILSFSGWNILSTFAGITKNQGVDVVINRFFGPTLNAARGVAAQVFAAFNNLISTITTASRPQTIQSYAVGNTQRTMNLMFTLSKFTLYIIYIVGLPIAVEADYVLKLWLGDCVPEYAVLFVRLSIILALFDKINTAVSGVVHATGNMKTYNIVVSVLNLLVLPLVLCLFKMGFPIEYSYYASIFIALVLQIISLFILRKLVKFSIREYMKVVVLPFIYITVLTMWIPFLPLHFMNEGFGRFVVVTMLSFVVNLTIIYLIGINNREKELTQELIKTFRR